MGLGVHGFLLVLSREYVNVSKGSSIGNCIGDYYRSKKEDTRSLDNGSYGNRVLY